MRAGIEVAVGVLHNTRGEVLIALRPPDRAHGGCWEFPGGKREAGESPRAALDRELREELGIVVERAVPFISIPWTYPERAVRLEVWKVRQWSGAPAGREGQRIEWVPIEALRERAFPAANNAIIQALRLPDRYLVTPEPGPDFAAFLQQAEQSFASGIRLCQYRAKSLQPAEWTRLGQELCALAHSHDVQVLANSTATDALRIGADGVHLSAGRLAELANRPLGTGHWCAASCHNPEELALAARLGCDFVVLGPVAPTLTHPHAQVLGWKNFGAWCADSPLPVYAIGGLGPSDVEQAQACGAQGIAAIRGLWSAAVSG